MRRRALAVVVLLALAIVPVMAAPAVVTGSLATGFTADLFNVNANPGTIGFYANPYVDIKATVSPWIATTFRLYYYMEYSSLNGIFSYTGAATGTGTSLVTATAVLPMIYYAYADVNLTQPFGIDPKQIDLLLTAGLHSIGDQGYNNLTYGNYGDVSGSSIGGPDWALALTAKIADLFWVKWAAAPRTFLPTGLTTVAAAPDWFVDVYMTPLMGPNGSQLKIEAAYDTNSQTTASGYAGLAIFDAAYVFNLDKAATSVFTAGAGIKYNLSSAASNTNPLQWVVDAKYATGTALTTGFNVAAEVWGTTQYSLYGSSLTAYLTPVVFNTGVSKDKDGKEVTDAQKFLSLDICSNLKMFFYTPATGTAPNLIQGWDNAIRLNIGTADLYIGYNYTKDKVGAWGYGDTFPKSTSMNLTAAPVQNGGAYIRLVTPF